jgi:hypothetical protein
MPVIKRTLQERMVQWENTRSRGLKSYLIKSWVIPYGIILLVMCFGILPFTSAIGVDVKSIGYFLVIFGPIFIFIIILLGIHSWNDLEREWARWKTEEKREITKKSGDREIFQKYPLFLLAFYSLPFFILLLLSFFLMILFWFSIPLLIIWLFLILVSGVYFLATMMLIKNPICGHGIFCNPEELYPDVEEKSPLKYAWRVFRGRPFTCLVCGERYILEKKGNQAEIVKLVKDT